MSTHLPTIAISMGDPGGIGPEVIVKSLMSPKVCQSCHPVIVGDLDTLRRAAQVCEAGIEFAQSQIKDKQWK